MQLSHIPKTSDHFGRYYTDSDIASLLIESMALPSPKLALDLGAGGGALVDEASPRQNLMGARSMEVKPRGRREVSTN